MQSDMLHAGDIVVCKYFNIENPNKRWIVYQIDHKYQKVIFRTIIDSLTWSQRVCEFYEVDAMIQQGHMRIIPEENIFEF